MISIVFWLRKDKMVKTAFTIEKSIETTGTKKSRIRWFFIMGICSEENVALYVYGYVLYGFRTCIYAYLYDCRTLDPFSIRTYTRSCVLHFPRTPFMIHLDMPFSMPMNTVPKHANISL